MTTIDFIEKNFSEKPDNTILCCVCKTHSIETSFSDWGTKNKVCKECEEKQSHDCPTCLGKMFMENDFYECIDCGEIFPVDLIDFEKPIFNEKKGLYEVFCKDCNEINEINLKEKIQTDNKGLIYIELDCCFKIKKLQWS